MNRQPSVARNVLSNWLGLATSVAVALVLTPVVVKALAPQRYGVWSFLNGLLAYSDLLYLGLGSSLIKYVAQARATNDLSGVRRLASVVLTIYLGLGVVCLLVFSGLSPYVPVMFADPLSPATARSASLACMLLGGRLLLAFISSAFSGVLCGYERFDFVNGVGVTSAIVRLIATLAFVPSASDPLVAVALVTCGVAAIEAATLAGLASWYVPQLSVRLVRPRPGEVGPLYHFGIQSFFVLLAFKLISYTDTTVIGIMLGSASVALYAVPLQLVEYARMSVGGFSGVFLPRLTQLSARDDIDRLRETYASATRVTCLLAGWIGALVIALGPGFLSLWIGPDFGAQSRTVLVFLTMGAFASAISTQAPFPFYQALHLVGRPAMILSIEAAFNLGLSIWLAPRMGIQGVALATAIPAVLVSGVLLPPFLCRRLKLPVTTLLVSSVTPGVAMLFLTLLVEWGLAYVLPASSYVMLLIRAAASAPVALLLIGVAFPDEDRRSILGIVRLGRLISRRT